MAVMLLVTVRVYLSTARILLFVIDCSTSGWLVFNMIMMAIGNVMQSTVVIYFIFIYLLNSAPVQTEYTRQSHSRTVKPEQGRKG